MEERRLKPVGYVGPSHAPEPLIFDQTPVPSAPPPDVVPPSDLMRRAALVSTAREMLLATDYVVVRSTETNAMLSPAWLAWREQLREVVRGNLDVISSEPARYA